MQVLRCILIACLFIPLTAHSQQKELAIIPFPKEVETGNSMLCVGDDISFYWEGSDLSRLFSVLQDDFLTFTGKRISKAQHKANSTFILNIDRSFRDEEYSIRTEDQINITGGSYEAVAMASITVLQSAHTHGDRVCWNKGRIHDFPDFNFRALLLDVARKKHDISTIKNIIMLCRWYKVNYLQLHLTDNGAFTFPSKAFPQLPTEGWVYDRDELIELVAFANDRGVKLIPELEVPGHAGQLLQKMPEHFAFRNDQLNRSTVNMGNKNLYPVMDVLFKEIAEVFHTSEFIHIGGDEADFRGMEDDPEIQRFLRAHDLAGIEELYWYFINRMHESVKEAGKQTIVWEGFSEKGNEVVDKDIVVMAWETMYQLPQDILAAGFKTINVSWKPLYVVNNRKWTTEEILDWNVYMWQNFHPAAPAFNTIQLDPHPGIAGAMMALWEQPEYVELSSSRKRLPAMIEETWNHSNKPSYQTFDRRLKKTDSNLSTFLTPLEITVEGLTYPNVVDGREAEETWFQDQIRITLAGTDDHDIRYTLDGSSVTPQSTQYVKPIVINETTKLRYRAFRGDSAVGMEMLRYYELRPLSVDVEGTFSIPIDELWKTLRPGTIKFSNEVKISISSEKNGTVRYVLGEHALNASSEVYTAPLKIHKTTLVKAGLFINDTLVGKSWIQRFEKD